MGGRAIQSERPRADRLTGEQLIAVLSGDYGGSV
jgi:hypothetical protein